MDKRNFCNFYFLKVWALDEKINLSSFRKGYELAKVKTMFTKNKKLHAVLV